MWQHNIHCEATKSIFTQLLKHMNSFCSMYSKSISQDRKLKIHIQIPKITPPKIHVVWHLTCIHDVDQSVRLGSVCCSSFHGMLFKIVECHRLLVPDFHSLCNIFLTGIHLISFWSSVTFCKHSYSAIDLMAFCRKKEKFEFIYFDLSRNCIWYSSDLKQFDCNSLFKVTEENCGRERSESIFLISVLWHRHRTCLLLYISI